MKLLFLVLNRAEKEWKMAPRKWALAKAQFAFLYGERFLRAMACTARPHTKFLTVPKPGAVQITEKSREWDLLGKSTKKTCAKQ